MILTRIPRPLIAALVISCAPVVAQAEIKTAIFAGGCFWCMEKDFEHVNGVLKVVSGYAGGTTENPTYKNYEKGGHIEVVEITYDDIDVTYPQLLHTFWRSVNPIDAGGQFCDRGYGYTTAIYALNDMQKEHAEASKAAIDASNILPEKIVTPIHDTVTFYPAEDYHQDYYKKSKYRYGYYRKACCRDATIRKLWGDEALSGIVY